MGIWFIISLACVVLSVGDSCLLFPLEVKNEKRIPIVRTNAENIDKKDKESLNALSDKIPPPQI